jgi:hypothetical protein
MALHLHHPGRDPEREGLYPHSVLHPPCAGASRRFYEECPRCSATIEGPCGDEDARSAQLELRAKMDATHTAYESAL